MCNADAEAFLNGVLDAGINFMGTAPGDGLAEERIVPRLRFAPEKNEPRGGAF